MSDLIKRQDAIWWVKTECNPYGKPTLDFESGKKVIEHLEHMPSADRPQEWIPCSERLPSEFSDDERMLATTHVGVDGLGVILIPAYDVKSWYLKGYISAWMPLPKPWKGADDE